MNFSTCSQCVVVVSAVLLAAPGCLARVLGGGADGTHASDGPGRAPAAETSSAASSTGFAITCTRATALFVARADNPDVWDFSGYIGLNGPVACPLRQEGQLPAPLHAQARLITASDRLAAWSRTEQDAMRPNAVAYMQYHYQTFEIVFAEKISLGDERVPQLAVDWSVDEALGKGAPDGDAAQGDAPRTTGTSAWIDELGAARPVFDRFYRRQGLSRRERNWAEGNIHDCFESIGKDDDMCSAESEATTHPTGASANPYAEAWFCEAYGHMNHAPLGRCHTTGTASSAHASCMDTCDKQWRACLLVRSEEACGGRKARCEKPCPEPPSASGTKWLEAKSTEHIPDGAIAP